METIQKKRDRSSSRSSSERDYSGKRFNGAERSLERRRVSTSTGSDSSIKNYEQARRQQSISPSRNKRHSSSSKARKLFSPTDKPGRRSVNRRTRSRSSSLNRNKPNRKDEEDTRLELRKSEWLLSSPKNEDKLSLGCTKTRRTRHNSSSSDFDTPVEKYLKTTHIKESFSPKTDNRGRIFSRKVEEPSFKFKDDPEFTSRQNKSPSSTVSEGTSPTKHTRKKMDSRRSSSSSSNCTSTSQEARFPKSNRRTQSSSLSVTDSSSTFENTDQHTRKRKSPKPNNNSRSTSFSSRDNKLKDNKDSRDRKRSLAYRSQSRSVSLSDNDSSDRDNKDKKDGRSNIVSDRIVIKKNSTVKSQVSCFKPNDSKRDRDYMQIQVVVRRRRSSDSSSSNSATNECHDFEGVERSRKRRRLDEFDNFNQTDSSSTCLNNKNAIRSISVVPSSARTDTHKDVHPVEDCEPEADGYSRNQQRRSLRDNLLLQNCCPYSDGTESNFQQHSTDDDTKFSSSAYGRMNKSGSHSGGSCVSPRFLTPQRTPSKHFEGSPRFSSPSFISNQSPKSTLRCLDQPHPWALDFMARSKRYSNTFVDSHCHIDLLYDRLGLSHDTRFSEFRRMVARSFPVNFEGCVAVFCYPKTYDPINPQDQLFATLAQDQGIWFAIGCHPKSATEFTARHEHGLRKALEQSQVVALGEIGLDYSGTFHRHAETQKIVLRKQLHMAMEMKLPLVLHCRDAYEDCLSILMEIVPRSWPIHLHCFCGNANTANVWLQTYPNLYIGLTPVITFRTAHDAINTARNIPLSRLLLETDSPYFVPGNIPKGRSSVSHPGFALFTAERIAELKNVPVDIVLMACRANTYNMYGI